MSSEALAVIIGGGNGIGEACSRLFAAKGWRVAVADLDSSGADRVAREIGASAVSFAADVRSPEGMENLAAQIEEQCGPAHALIVSSGAFQENVSPHELPIETWNSIMDVNLSGTYFANRAFGRRMALRSGGSIVNIASITGMGSSPLHAYGTSKAGVIGLTQNLAGEWGRSNVRVNCVSPGVTMVERIMRRRRAGTGYHLGDLGQHAALGRSAEPIEIAETVEFLASDRASAVTGANLLVDCGWMAASMWEMLGGVRASAAEL